MKLGSKQLRNLMACIGAEVRAANSGNVKEAAHWLGMFGWWCDHYAINEHEARRLCQRKIRRRPVPMRGGL